MLRTTCFHGYIRHMICCLSLFLMTGCATPTLYLNNYGLAPENVAKIQQRLEQEGHQVQVISAQPPNTIQSSTIVTGANATLTYRFNPLIKTLNGLGYPNVAVAYITSGNHWYRGDNIGLYLFDAGRHVTPEKQFTGAYTTTDCVANYQLKLSSLGSFVLTKEQQLVKRGTWQVTALPYLVFRYDSENIEDFLEASFEDTDKATQLIHLSPVNSSWVFPDCVFTPV